MIASTSRILILDADPQRRRWIVGLLEQVSSAAHIVWPAESVDQAIEVCRQRPDSIVVGGDWEQADINRLTEAIDRLQLATPIPILLIRHSVPGSRLPDWIVETFADVLEQASLTAEVLQRSVRHAAHEVAMLHVLEQRRREIEQLKSQSLEAPAGSGRLDESSSSVAPRRASLTPVMQPARSDQPLVANATENLAISGDSYHSQSIDCDPSMDQAGGVPFGVELDRTIVGWQQTALPAPPPLPLMPPPLPSELQQDFATAAAMITASGAGQMAGEAVACEAAEPAGSAEPAVSAGERPEPDGSQVDSKFAAPAHVGPADELARQLQTWVLPSGSPLVEGLDIAGLSRPALGTGGDFYDYVKLKDRRMGIVVGDATGSGFHAAALMMAARCYLRALSNEQHQPGALLERVNDLLVDDTRDVDFLTMFLLCVDPRSRSLVYAAAGQQSYVLRASGELQTLKSTSMPIGIRSETVIRSAGPLTLDAGDLLILPTDGVVKTQSPTGESYGVHRIRECVWKNRDLPARMIASLLQQDCRKFAGPSALVDDFTVVVVKRES